MRKVNQKVWKARRGSRSETVHHVTSSQSRLGVGVASEVQYDVTIGMFWVRCHSAVEGQAWQQVGDGDESQMN